MLLVLARCHKSSLTPAQLGTLAKMTPSGGTWNSYVGTLKAQGLLVQEGGAFRITEVGLAMLGKDVPPEPMTTAEVLALWRPALKTREVEILERLIKWHPGGLTKEEIADALDLAVDGGGFGAYLGTLTRYRLVEKHEGLFYASDVLFPKRASQ